jgi:hypothetical protein
MSAMSPGKDDTDRKIVPCARCRKEVRVSEAKVAEAVDYIIHFCDEPAAGPVR